ncbi:MAG: hypothetical protein NZV14_04070 [Bryobacteraceae bacterium]|nr:hypothetical protein [Bryobacteraceae bacterium]MDW8377308.1 hypothetical protein [Bryobacterales bacterium]
MKWMLFCFLWQDSPATQFEADRLRQLLSLRRVFVDKLSGDNPDPIRDMLIAAIQQARVFIVTENPERADAFLRGTADWFVYNEIFQSSEGVGARSSFSVNTGAATRNNPRRGVAGAVAVDDREAVRIQERRQESRVSLRLVNRDGDVLWSTTQESFGAKFKSAAADVVDKAAQRLLEDYDRARSASRAKP